MLYIWVRRAVDWSDEHGFLAQVQPGSEPQIELWNQTFTMPFHVFRLRIRAIAQLNLSRVENSVCAPWDAIPEGALVVPVDDDDWFGPDLGTVIESAGPANAYRWTPTFVEVPVKWDQSLALLRRRLPVPTRSRWTCTTNNYAITKVASARDRLENHMKASTWFDEHADRVHTIERRLSVMNRTLASQTSLGLSTPISGRALVRKYRWYKRLYARTTAPEIEWCRPYLALMAGLMDELEVKRGGAAP